MIDPTDEIYASRLPILQSLFDNKISAPEAAAQLATASLSDSTTTTTTTTTLETSLTSLWNLIITLAADSPTHHDKLVDLLVDISELPDATDPATGSPLTLHDDMQVWKDLPTLGWTFRDEWNFSINPNFNSEKRSRAISRWININRFAALLMATEEAVFASFSWFALVTLRQALETPSEQIDRARNPIEAWVPAAAAWIEVLGVEMYEWDEEFPSGGNRGAPGKGGPLWTGKHEFCKERWALWRGRFGGLAKGDGGEVEGVASVLDSVRKVAGDAEVMMREIEAGDVE
ncbi:hypothetical protein BJY01DRAFT_263355 [Aspergillus pseudoustus]|uniref:Uncharacterized protein n=1 Tax=Aspergillus pseudoustus TaxID=1810923 RepID=A0ABR4K279_9EURO